MNCIRRFRSTALTAALVAVIAAPTKGEAQSTGSHNVLSSASAACLVSNCSNVRFALNLAGNVFIDTIRLFSANTTVWNFGSLLGAYDANNNPLTQWIGQVFQGGLELKSGGNFAAEPIYLDVAMSIFSTPAQLHTGLLTYTGQGHFNSTGTPPSGSISFGGTVTPEPASMMLLGTGLLGVVGAARRRRQAKQ